MICFILLELLIFQCSGRESPQNAAQGSGNISHRMQEMQRIDNLPQETPPMKDYNYASMDNNLLNLNSTENVLPKPAALAAPERSTYDSGYTKTANFIMNTALKLPPHILPTLEELDANKVKSESDKRSHVGVYLPDKKNNVGLYLPLPKSSRTRKNEGRINPRRRRKGPMEIGGRRKPTHVQRLYNNRVKKRIPANRRSIEVVSDRDRQSYKQKKPVAAPLKASKPRKKKKNKQSNASIIPKHSIAGRLFRFGVQNAKAFTRRHQNQNGGLQRNLTPRRKKRPKRPWKYGQTPPYGHTQQFPPISLQKDYLEVRQRPDGNPYTREKSSSGEIYASYQRDEQQPIEPKEYDYIYSEHPYAFEPADFRLPWNNYDDSVAKSIEESRSSYLDFDDDEEYDTSTKSNRVEYKGTRYENTSPKSNSNDYVYEDHAYSSVRKPKRQVSSNQEIRPAQPPKHRNPLKRRPHHQLNLDTGISRYVPTVVKTVLAKSFLRHPRPYLKRLAADNKKRQRHRRKGYNSQFITKKASAATEPSVFIHDVDITNNKKGDMDNSRFPVKRRNDNLPIRNNFFVNKQFEDPYILYNEVVESSKEYDLPSEKEETSWHPNPGDFETSKDHVDEKELGFRVLKTTPRPEAGDNSDNTNDHLNIHNQYGGKSPPNLNFDFTEYDFGSRIDLPKHKKSQQNVFKPYIKDSKPFINYLQDLSFLSEGEYFDEGINNDDFLNGKDDTTLCFCCGNDEDEKYAATTNVPTLYHIPQPLKKSEKHRRNKRAIRILDPLKSRMVYENMDLIKESLDCQNQDPIVVKLSNLHHHNQEYSATSAKKFDPDIDQHRRNQEHHREDRTDIYYVPTTTRNSLHTPKIKYGNIEKVYTNVPAATRSTVLPNSKFRSKSRGYYDPKRLSFVFSTPSPLTRRYLSYRDKDIITKVPFINKNVVSNEINKEASTTPMQNIATGKSDLKSTVTDLEQSSSKFNHVIESVSPVTINTSSQRDPILSSASWSEIFTNDNIVPVNAENVSVPKTTVSDISEQ